MTVIATFDRGQHIWAAGRTDLAPAFRRARRHSRRIRLLRVGIPTAAVIVSLLYMLSGLLNPLAKLNLPSVRAVGISGTKITMDAPRLAGFTRDNRPYELTASAAAQDLKHPQLIELQGVRAKMQLTDGNTVNVTADGGLYDTKTEVVTLNKNVVVATTSGTTVHLAEATLDMRTNHVTSDKPVEVNMADGRVEAQQMEVVNGGAIVYFRGGVHMSLVKAASDETQVANPQELHP